MFLDATHFCISTDIPYPINWGQPLMLGPGSILVAHPKDEFVLKKDLEEAVGLYSVFVRRLLADDAQVSAIFGNNYDASFATIKGRFWYVQLKKRL